MRIRLGINQPHHPTVHLYMHEMGHMELHPAEKELKKSWTDEGKTSSRKSNQIETEKERIEREQKIKTL